MSTPSFAQQGQLDWVSLSQMSMTCTLDVAARIMNAGLDMCTPMVGRGLCSSFSFPTTGQLLLRASLGLLPCVLQLEEFWNSDLALKTSCTPCVRQNRAPFVWHSQPL